MLDTAALDQATALLEALARDGHPTAADALARLMDEPPDSPREARNRLIAECRENCFPNLKTAPAATAIASAIKNYAATRWRRDESHSMPPYDINYSSKPEYYAFHIMKTGAQPLSEHMIRKILAQ